jgi:flagellar hook-basal body complex protein FliE
MVISSTGHLNMPTPALSSIQGVSQGAAQTSETGTSFAGLLERLASNTSTSMRSGEAAALSAIQGDMQLQTVVDKVMAAERTFQTALAVRDKAVSAYLEISRMQI